MLRTRAKKTKPPKVAVIGGGSWATALVKILLDNNNKIYWWIKNTETIDYIKNIHHNPKYLSSVEINTKKCKINNKLKRIIRFSDIIILAVPAAFLKDTLSKIKPNQLKKKIIVSAIKGIIPEDDLSVAEFIHQEYEIPFDRFVIIAGPCHAEEIAQEKLSYLTIAGPNIKNTNQVSSLLANRYVKTKINGDIFGIEYAAVLKNIIAIASGIFNGLRFGDNFQAVLISNAIQEIERFINKIDTDLPGNHKGKRDIKASAYLGDLLVTTYSQFSRNRTFGNMIGKGYSVRSAQFEMNMIAEGYYAVESIYKINKKYKVDMPITNAVYNILYNNADPAVEMNLLADHLQ